MTRNHKYEKDIDNNDSVSNSPDDIETDTFNGADNRRYSQFTFTESEIDTINSTLSQQSLSPREAKLILGILVVAKNIHYQINIEKLICNDTKDLTIFEDFIQWFCFTFYYPEEELYLQTLLVNSPLLNTETMIAKIIKESNDKKTELKFSNYSLVRNLKLKDISEFSSISKLFVFSFESID